MKFETEEEIKYPLWKSIAVAIGMAVLTVIMTITCIVLEIGLRIAGKSFVTKIQQ